MSTTKAPRVCVPKRVPKELAFAAAQAAVKENRLNRVIGAGPNVKPEHMALMVGRKWANGRTLHVRFLNGDDVQKAKTELQVHKWEAYANIKFVFDNSPNAEIRVAFYDGSSQQWTDQGSWSYIGTDCLVTPADEQTVNFGWLDDSTEDDEWQRVVVHEFGHALGCIHEDQQPAETIKWNKDVVYKYFEGPPNNWSKEDVDNNVLNPSGQAGIVNTVFDPVSIMAYAIPAEFTLDGKGVPGGVTLSALDKKMIGEMYPIGTPVVAPQTNVLVPDGPICNGVIDAGHASNKFELNVTKDGTYRVWTSFPASTVTVHSPNQVVGKGTQQVTLHLKPSPYAVVVQANTPGNTAHYRVHVTRIS